MTSIRFGNDGWTARLDEGFTEDSVRCVGEAVGMLLEDEHPGSRVLVGYDTRYHARDFAHTLAGVLESCGLQVLVADGFCPLPALAWTAALDEQTRSAIMVTASHLSANYQGVRIRMTDGSSAPLEFTSKVEALVPSEPTVPVARVSESNIVGPYFNHLTSLVDMDRIRDAGLKVVVDPLYGSGAGHVARLLKEHGIATEEIHGDAYGDFHGLHPNPIEPWVDGCEKAVVASGADIGLVFDGDADRSCAITAKGAFLTPHRLEALVLEHLVEREGAGRVAATLSCSQYLWRQAERLGCEVVRTPIGFRWVRQEMTKGDVIFGAEEYGGIAIPKHLLGRDGILAVLLLLEMMVTRGKSLEELIADLDASVGHFDYARRDIRSDPGQLQAFRNLLPGLNPESLAGEIPSEVSHTDGLHLVFKDGSWVLMRPSRTEAIVRIYAEATTVERRDELMEAACEYARGEGGFSLETASDAL